MPKVFIKNRKNQKICVLVEEKKNPRGLVFVMHGLGSFKESATVKSRSDVFSEANFTVVRFDTTNTLGESDGCYEKATTTNYYQDLEDVIGWSKKQTWYIEPFVLIGSSLGGFCVAYYAEKHTNEVKALTLVAPVVSGRFRVEAHKKYDLEKFKLWRKTGWFVRESVSKPGVTLKLPWSHMVDGLKYNLLPRVNKLTMPVLIIVGEKDESTPVYQVRKLYKLLPGQKELHIIKGAPHVFRTKKYLNQTQSILKKWIGKVL